MEYNLKLWKLWIGLLLILAGSINSVYAQKKIRWMKFEDAYIASQKAPRKIFVDIYADWCHWCKVLDKDTFSDTSVIRILNENYYPVKLNSESKDVHTVGDNKFSSPELAATLAMLKPNEKLGLPTMVIINEKMQLLEMIQGFRKPDFMKERLSFHTFNKNIAPQVKWMKFSDAVEATKKKPRKIFVDIYADWCGWCKVLDRDTFSDSVVAKILNEQYYPVKLDAESKETHTLQDGRKVSSPELAASLAASKPGEQYGLPSMIVLSEEVVILTRIQGAQKPDFMAPALLFFSENHYLEKSWETYSKEYADKIKH